MTSADRASEAALSSIADLLGGGRAAEAERGSGVSARHAEPRTGSAAPACDRAAATRPSRRSACLARRALQRRAAFDRAALQSRQRRARARRCGRGARRARAGVRARPTHPAVLLGLGNARRAAGDLAGAREAYVAATRALAAHAGAWLNLAAVELALGEMPDAERNARHALTLAPGHPEGLLLLGHVLAAQRRYADAASRLRSRCALGAVAMRAFRIRPASWPRSKSISRAAAALHARALALDPSLHHALGQLVFLKRQLCDWRDLDALSARLRARVAEGAVGIAPFAFLSEPAGADEQLRCARTAAAAIDAGAAPLRRASGSGRESAHGGPTARRLRLQRLRQSSDRPSDRRADRSAAR